MYVCVYIYVYVYVYIYGDSPAVINYMATSLVSMFVVSFIEILQVYSR